MGACDGLRVLEVARGMPGALAGMVLADHGAEVVRIEGSEGDPYAGEAGERCWDRGKRRLALDLRAPEERRIVGDLARSADVVLLGLSQAAAERFGLTLEALSRDNPGLVYATITGFGWGSPFRGDFAVEGMVHARSGSMVAAQSGRFRDGPVFIAPGIAGYGAALLCVQGILAALHVRHATGLGQHVDTSLLQGLLCYRGLNLVRAERLSEEVRAPAATVQDPRGLRPLFNISQCADGRWISMAAFTRAFCEVALGVMGLEHLLEDPRFKGLPSRFASEADQVALLEILWERFRQAPLDEWLRRFGEKEVPCEPVLSVEEFRSHPQLWANGLAVRAAGPVAGEMVQPGVLGHLARTPGSVGATEARASTSESVQGLLRRWGPAARVARGGNGASPADFSRGPLTGLKVLDFTAFVAGPTATRQLADLGAEVIKVEPPTGDAYRMGHAQVGSMAVLNRGKKSVAMDLKSPGSLQVLHSLARSADIVVYNYRLGVEDRLGLDYQTLSHLNPRVIVCRMTSFGAEGEQRFRPAYDTSMSALSGNYVEQAGEGNHPTTFGGADVSTGIAATAAILLALRARDRTGVGQLVDVTMIGTMAYLAGSGFLDYPGRPPRPRMDRGQHGLGPLYRLYRTADGWLFLAAIKERHWAALKDVLGVEGLADGRFATARGRAEHADHLARTLEEVFRARPTAAWEGTLGAAGVPCADPTVEMERFVLDSSAVRERLTVAVPHPRYGALIEPGPVVHYSRTPCRIDRPEPSVGQHTREVLGSLGLAEAAIEGLRRDGAVVIGVAAAAP